MESETATAERLKTLVGNIGGGDQQAFAELYDATASRVYGLARRVLRDQELSEDAVQETYLQVWRTAEKYSPAQGSVMSWLMMIVHRRSVDTVRKEQARVNREDRYEASAVANGNEVDDAAVARDESDRVRGCLQTLTSSQRDSVDLAYYRGLTYRQVAERLGAGLPAIKSRIRDGLARLKKCLGVDRDG